MELIKLVDGKATIGEVLTLPSVLVAKLQVYKRLQQRSQAEALQATLQRAGTSTERLIVELLLLLVAKQNG